MLIGRSMPRHHHALSCAVVGLLLGLLAACTDDPDPKEPAVTPTTASASATPTVPTLPDTAKADTPEGAIAFVEHYVSLLNYASDTGDVTALQAASAPSCEGCNSYIKLYKETYENGGYFKDSGWTITDTVAEEQAGELLVFADQFAPGGEFKADSNSPVEYSKDSSDKLVFSPVRAADSWQLSSLARQEGA